MSDKPDIVVEVDVGDASNPDIFVEVFLGDGGANLPENGEPGQVLTKTEEGAEWRDPTPGGVTSVNGKTGDGTLYGSDINLTMLASQTVADAIQNLNTQKLNKPTVLTQTILSGASSVSFTNDAIGDDSEIDIYLNKSGVNVTGWTQSGHVFTINLNNVTESTVVTVEVFN
jgi:hypothetical protein